MRKLMAWVLALMMLCTPLMSLAESCTAELQLTQIDLQTILSPVFDVVGLGDVYTSVAQKAIDFAEELLKISTFRLQWQDNGIRLAWLIDQQEAASMTVVEDEDTLLVTNSFMPDYAIVLTQDADQMTSQDADWESFYQAAAAELAAWVMQLYATTETGTFAGDTYENGVYCAYITVTDRDVALLLEGLMLCMEENESVSALMQQELEEEDLLTIRRKILRIAESSMYRYEVTLVGDQSENVIGITMQVYQDETWVGALSMGNKDGWTGVLQLPADDGMCYADLHVKDNTLAMNVYQCDSSTSYQEAAAQETWKTMSLTICADVSEENGAYAGSVLCTSALKLDELSLSDEQAWSGNLAADFTSGSVEMTEKFNGTKVIHQKITISESEPFTLPANLTCVNVMTASEDEWEALQESMASGMDDAAISLFKILPQKLLRKFIELETEMNNFQQTIPN